MEKSNAYYAMRNLRSLAAAFLILTAAYSTYKPLAELEAETSTCFTKTLFNFACAGCGLTKSMVAFWQGEWALAWHYHAFSFVVTLACIALLASFFWKKASDFIYNLLHKNAFWLSGLGLFFGYYLLRLSTGSLS